MLKGNGSAVNSSLEVSDDPFFLDLFLTSGAASFSSVFSGTGVVFLTGLAGVDGWDSGFLLLGLADGFTTGLALLAGALLAGAFAGATGRDGFFGKDFTGLAGAFLEGVGSGFALGGAFFGAGFFAGALAGGFGAGFGDRVAFLAGALGFGFDAATGFLAAGFADFVGRGLPDLGVEFAVGLEGFESFLAALGFAAGRDGLFEEVVFVFNLLSVRPGEKAVEHLPHGS